MKSSGLTGEASRISVILSGHTDTCLLPERMIVTEPDLLLQAPPTSKYRQTQTEGTPCCTV
jgi:hypothetical protein